MMVLINATASQLWHLLWQCHCHRAMLPLSLHFSAKKTCATTAFAVYSQGVKNNQPTSECAFMLACTRPVGISYWSMQVFVKVPQFSADIVGQ